MDNKPDSKSLDAPHAVQHLRGDIEVLLPSGERGKETLDSLRGWASHLREKKEVFIACIGTPTAPLNPYLKSAMQEYWSKVDTSPIPYGEIAGELLHRQWIAEGFRKYYNDENILAKNVLFTTGGLGGLKSCFASLNELNSKGKFIMLRPYYSYYIPMILLETRDTSRFHFIDISSGDYRFTAKALQESLDRLKESDSISGFILCDPVNPMGSSPGLEEWKKIAEILKKKCKNVPIVLDEAYSELYFGGKHVSLISAAPELSPI